MYAHESWELMYAHESWELVYAHENSVKFSDFKIFNPL